MIIRRLSILNFKNIADAELEFSAGVNCVLGDNGMGKSNLLEAISYLCMARPMTALRDAELLRHGAGQMLVKGYFDTPAGTDEVSFGMTEGKRKSFKRNGKEYKRIADHIGRLPLVAVTPHDTMLLTGSADERRRMADRVISQTDPTYLSHLIQYRQALDARNRLLRSEVTDPLMYEAIEAAMGRSMTYIYEARRQWAEAMSAPVADYYRTIAGGAEEAAIRYESRLAEMTPQELFDSHRTRDHALGYTSGGVHRDDFPAMLGSHDMRRLGSQGQMKTYVTALRLAEYSFLSSRCQSEPILLLDDVFDKLDSHRVESIMHIVTDPARGFRQIFVTDTNRTHLDNIMSRIGGSYTLTLADHGTFTPISHTDQ